MKTLRRTLISASLFAVFAHQARAEQFTIGSGDWFNPAIWEDEVGNHAVPSAGGEPLVRIKSGHTITLSAGLGETKNELDVGQTTNGTLTLNGGDLSPGQRIHVGNSGSIGILNITSPDSRLETDFIFIGRQIGSTGTLHLSAGDVLANQHFFIGGASGTGVVNMSGGNIAAANFTIGDLGSNGTLNMSGGFIGTTPGSANFFGNGGGSTVVMENDAHIQFGAALDGGGLVTLSNTAHLEVQGAASFGNLTINNTARVTALGNITFDTGLGNGLTVTGGTLESDLALNIGDNSPTEATISGGNLIAHHSAFFGNGVNAESNASFSGGALEVPGDKGPTAGRGQLIVAGNGLATVTFGGTSFADATGVGFVGSFAGSDGLMIAKDDAVLVFGGGLNVGSSGTGEVQVEGNARITAADLLFVGQSAGSTGHFDMSGGTVNVTKVTTNGGDTVIGLNGTGTAAVGPGILTTTDLFVGANSGSDGFLQVRDGADITVSAFLSVGLLAGSGGELSMLGGRIQILGATGDLRVGSAGGGAADIGGTSVLTAGDDIIVGLSTGSFGTLSIGGSAQVSCVDDFKIASDADDVGGGLVMRGDGVLNVGDSMFVADNSLAGVSVDLDGNAVLTVGNDLVLGDNSGINLRVTMGELGGNPRLSVTDIINFPRLNCDNSTLTGEMFGGLLEGRSVFIGDSSTVNTTLNFTMSGGTIRSNGGFFSIEGKGTTFTLSGGVIEGSAVNGLSIGSDFHFNGAFAMSQSGGLVTSPLDLTMFAFQESNGTYTLTGNGQIGVGRDFLLGTDSPMNSTLIQQGGVVEVAREFFNRGVVQHTMKGGQLLAQKFRVEAPFDNLSQTVAHFDQSGGFVGVDQNASFENGVANLTGGTFESASITAGITASSTTSLSVKGTSEVAVTGNLTLGHPTNQHLLAELRHLENGLLALDGTFINNRGGDYLFSGGVLTRITPGVLPYLGNFAFGKDATLRFLNNKTMTVSGTFESLDTDAVAGNFTGGGKIDVTGVNLNALSGQTQFIPLINVAGNTANLAGDTALDEIELIGIGGPGFVRVSEQVIENGGFTGRAFALVEGQGMGGSDGDGVIGIAYRNTTIATLPIANPDTIFRVAGQPASVPVTTLLANDTAENGLTVQFVAVAATSAGSQAVSSSGGVVTYTAAPGFTTNDSFLYTITNGDANADGIVTVIVVQPGDDKDNDGMDNAYELEHFGSVTGGDPAVDSDGDGRSNLEEFLALTDPNNGADSFKAEMVSDGGFRIRVQTHPGRVYQLNASGTLATFDPVGPPVMGDGTIKELTDPNNPPGPFFTVTVSLAP